MKRSARFIFGLVGVPVAIGGLVYHTLLKFRSETIYHLADGINVLAQKVPQDDVTEALDLQVWKFDIVTDLSYRAI